MDSFVTIAKWFRLILFSSSQNLENVLSTLELSLFRLSVFTDILYWRHFRLKGNSNQESISTLNHPFEP